jgi:hypothetical protein
VWHAYYRDSKHVKLQYSVSLAREGGSISANRLSRANRYHHWADITRFKQSGVLIYDLGGFYAGDFISVNQFKEGLGGQTVTVYHCTSVLTVLGRVLLDGKLVKDWLSSRTKVHRSHSRSVCQVRQD